MAEFEINEQRVLTGIMLEQEETEIIVPDGVVELGEWVFNKTARTVTKVELPDSVEVIGAWCFSDCKYLQEIKLSKRLRIIRRCAFFNTGLTTVRMPKSLTILESNAFCKSALQEIFLNEGVVEIPEGTFSYCNNLQSIVVPASVKKVGKNAFKYSEKLESVTWLGKPMVVPSAFKYTNLKMNYGPDGQCIACEDTEHYRRPSFKSKTSGTTKKHLKSLWFRMKLYTRGELWNRSSKISKNSVFRNVD